jgi:hypothetical protein
MAQKRSVNASGVETSLDAARNECVRHLGCLAPPPRATTARSIPTRQFVPILARDAVAVPDDQPIAQKC